VEGNARVVLAAAAVVFGVRVSVFGKDFLRHARNFKFAVQIVFESQLFFVIVVAAQPARSQCAAGRVACVGRGRIVNAAVFLGIFVVVVIQLAGITPVVVEIVFYFGECVRFVVNAFVPVVAQIGIARQVQCHTPVVGLGVFALIEAAPSDFGVVADGCIHHAVKRGIAAFDAVFKIFVAF